MYNYRECIELLTTAILFALIAYVWITVLVAPGQILFPLKRLYWDYLCTDDIESIDVKLHQKIFHVLFECYFCLGGQISLWYCVFTFETFVNTIVTIFTTIFVLILIRRIIE